MKWYQMGDRRFFSTNPDLADSLGRTDLDFLLICLIFVGFQISGFPGLQISRFPEICPGPGLGRAWARDSWHTLSGSSATAPDHKVGEI